MRDGRHWVGVLILVLLAGTLVSFVVAARTWWMPPRVSVQGRMVDEVIHILLGLGAVYFVVAQFFLALPLLRRGQPNPEGFTPSPWTRMPGLAAVLAVAVLVVADTTVLALSERDWFRLYSPPPSDALPIEVVGRQFQWYFRYPGPDGKLGRVDPRLISPDNPMGLDRADPAAADDIVTVNDLRLPVGRPVAFHITAVDVIHSFNLPNFRVKQDAVPGRIVTVWTTPDRTGTYEVACAQLCGVGHYTMRATVTVESAQAFAQWVASQEAGQRSLPPSGAGPAAGDLAAGRGPVARFSLVAGQTPANGGLNFNGATGGHLVLTVPEGAQVELTLVNQGALPHSLQVVPEATTPPPTAEAQPAFPGAETPNPQVGAGPGQTAQASFVASRPGRYLLICGVPGHAVVGMYAVLEVSPQASTRPHMSVK